MRKNSVNKFTTKETLELYVERAQELVDSSFIKSNAKVNLNINYSKKDGGQISSTQPDEEIIKSYLLTFRHFVSNDEPIYQQKIYNLCYENFTLEDLIEEVKENRASWATMHKKNPLQLVIDNRNFPPEKMLNLWINGHYFHSDTDKRKLLKELPPEQIVILKSFFISILIDASKHIFHIANLILYAIKNDHINFKT